MESLAPLLAGFHTILTPANLMWSFIGVSLGTAIGVLPGIGPALTIALLLPVAYNLDPTSAFVIFGGIYYGACYGSSTTAILVNTPGETGSIVTAIDGYKMARQGRGGAALATAAIGSFIAGTIGTILLTLLAPQFAILALAFGPAEYFALACLAFVAVSSLFGRSPLPGLLSLLVGLTLALVGIDPQSAYPRYTFGTFELLEGVGITTAAVGMFAVGEILWLAWEGKVRPVEGNPLAGSAWMTRDDWRRSWKPWLRGSFLGFPLGTLPAGGTEVPTFLSYTIEKKLSKHPEEFGEGAIEGVAGPEATNNSAVAGVLVPLLTFGLPTSATAAIMLAAFQQYGIQPGPLLFHGNPDLVWAIIASLYVGNVMLLVLNLPLVGFWVRLLTIPPSILYGGVLFFAIVGVFAASNSGMQILMAIGLGLLAFGFRLGGIPIAPAIVGLVLAPLAELQLRRALQIVQGDWLAVVSRPITATLLAICLALLLAAFVRRLREPETGEDVSGPVG
jgi:putative tricarboxylic transport membrane protein